MFVFSVSEEVLLDSTLHVTTGSDKVATAEAGTDDSYENNQVRFRIQIYKLQFKDFIESIIKKGSVIYFNF